MSKSWREKAASEAANSLYNEVQGFSTMTEDDEAYVNIVDAVNPFQTCDCCSSKENIKAINIGNKKYGDNSRMVIHLCQEHMKMFGKKLLESCK